MYEFDELSDKAKERALQDWNEYNDDPFMQSHMINVLKEKLDERKIKYDVDSIDVQYSLSYCQGDGFMFEGVFEIGKYTAKVKHSGCYYHSKSRTIEWLDIDGNDADMEGGMYKDFVKMYEEVCKEMERIGYDEIEYQRSEENFQQECEGNGYMFEENGARRDYHEGVNIK